MEVKEMYDNLSNGGAEIEFEDEYSDMEGGDFDDEYEIDSEYEDDEGGDLEGDEMEDEYELDSEDEDAEGGYLTGGARRRRRRGGLIVGGRAGPYKAVDGKCSAPRNMIYKRKGVEYCRMPRAKKEKKARDGPFRAIDGKCSAPRTALYKRGDKQYCRMPRAKKEKKAKGERKLSTWQWGLGKISACLKEHKLKIPMSEISKAVKDVEAYNKETKKWKKGTRKMICAMFAAGDGSGDGFGGSVLPFGGAVLPFGGRKGEKCELYRPRRCVKFRQPRKMKGRGGYLI